MQKNTSIIHKYRWYYILRVIYWKLPRTILTVADAAITNYSCKTITPTDVNVITTPQTDYSHLLIFRTLL